MIVMMTDIEKGSVLMECARKKIKRGRGVGDTDRRNKFIVAGAIT